MKNTILKYREETIDFEKYKLNPVNIIDIIKLRKYIKSNLNMFYMKNVNDNLRFEVLAYKEYKDSSLWDILFLLNYGDEGMFNFVKSDEWVNKEIETELNKQIQMYKPYFDYKKLKEVIKERIENKNDKNRKVLFIKPEYIPVFKEAIKEMVYDF